MQFRGQHEHSLDSKDRLTIPSRQRADLSDGVVLLAGLDPCVEIWPADGFEEFTARVLKGLNPLGAKARMLNRRFHGNAEQEQLDGSGRVRIAGHLLKHASLTKESVVVGVADHLEVWEPEAWRRHSAEIDAQAVSMAEEVAESYGPAV